MEEEGRVSYDATCSHARSPVKLAVTWSPLWWEQP